MDQIAKKRKGKCISRKYVNRSTKLEFECEKKHRWHAAPTNVMDKGSWCPKCFNEKRKNGNHKRKNL